MKVGVFDASQRAAWDDAVTRIPGVTFHHQLRWRDVIGHCFPRFEPVYLCVEETGGLCGLLPLYHVRRAPFGSALLSMPLGVYGGPVAAHREALSLLRRRAIEEGKKRNVAYVELRCRDRDEAVSDAWIRETRYATFRRALPGSSDETLGRIPRKQRAEVRKAIDLGLLATFSKDIEPFFSLYATSMRNLGSPVFSRRYYQALLEIFADSVDVATVSYRGKPQCTVLSFYFQGEVLPFYGGGLPEARATSAFPFMYWALMAHAVEQGCDSFDFGRSMSGTGAYAFKKNFGFKPEALDYQIMLVRAKQPPDVNPENPRIAALSAVWRRLPLPVVNRLGPLVSPLIV